MGDNSLKTSLYVHYKNVHLTMSDGSVIYKILKVKHKFHTRQNKQALWLLDHLCWYTKPEKQLATRY